jgi:hypothetical protein
MATVDMDRGQGSVLREGVVAGCIGAAVVAVWFLIFDFARGRPLLTPALLGAVVFSGVRSPADVDIAAGPILGYTVLHGLAFIVFGVVAASLVAASEREPSLLIAVAILFASFEVFFLALEGALGQSVFGALVSWSVLVGNFLAAVAMLAYFLSRHRALPRRLVGGWSGVLGEGTIAGLIGAAVVALWFLAVDAARGEPLRTPTLLGTGLLKIFAGAHPVIAYTVVHGLAFVLFGIAAAVLIAGAEQSPAFLFGVIILFTAFEVFFFGAVMIGARWILDELAGWTILAGNLLASAAMLAYFFTGHRALARRLNEAFAEED